MPPETLLVSNITCRRDQRSLFKPVSFELLPGSIMHIKGPNGIGKTTLLRCLAGLGKPSSGYIHWSNSAIYDSDDYKEQLFFLAHKNAVKSSLTVAENLCWSPQATTALSMDTLMAALETVGLAAKRDHQVGQLSLGQKQRVALANLMLMTKKIWILDEPLSALDRDGLGILQELMSRHLAQEGIAVLTSHQDLPDSFPDVQSLELYAEIGTEYEVIQ